MDVAMPLGRRGSYPCRLLLDGKKDSTRCYREQTRDRASQKISVFSVGLPPTQNRPPLRGQKKRLRVDRPTPQTDRHRLVRERGE